MKIFETKIYALTDYDEKIFYIGCTTMALKKRLIGHLAGCKINSAWSNSLKDQKIRSLDFRIMIKKLQSINIRANNCRSAQRMAQVYERKWIRIYQDLGFELCNCSFTENKKIKGSSKAKNRIGINQILIMNYRKSVETIKKYHESGI